MIKKVFVSLPMRDRPIEDIRADIHDIFELVAKTMYLSVDDVELIDTVWEDEPDIDTSNESVWYLGKSINALAEADIVVFHPGWREARGCIIEHMICAMYNIPYYDISMNYQENVEDDVKDYTHDWDFAGEINAELSKRIAEEEDLGEDDILNNEDVEDALGFEHDDVDDLIESDPDLNPDAQHSAIDISIMDEFDEDGNPINFKILEPGEYDADAQ